MKQNIVLFVIGILIAIMTIVLFMVIISPKEESSISYNTYRIELKGSKQVRVEEGDIFIDPGYYVYNSDNSISNVNVEVRSNVNTSIPGKYEITYSINGEIVSRREVIVEKKKDDNQIDNGKVIFRLNEGNDYTLLLNSEFIDPMYTAVTKDGSDISNYVTRIGKVNSSKEGIFEIKYRLSYNGEIYELTRKIYVVKKDVDFHLNGDSLIEIDYNSKFEDPGVVLTYNGKDYSKDVIVDNNVDTSRPGEYIIIYKYKNKDFNAFITRNVVVKKEDVVISFELLGDSEIKITKGDNFIDPLFSAKDDKGRDYKDQVVINGNVDVNKVGSYEISYYLKVNDYEKTLKRVVNVVDKVKIDFKLLGGSTINITAGDTFVDPLYKAIGNDGYDYSKYVEVIGYVNTNVVGTYTIKYKLVYDGVEQVLIRTVIVNKKVISVNFYLKGNSTINIKLNGAYSEPGFVAIDQDGKSLNKYVSISGVVNTNRVGTYTIRYNLNYEGISRTLTRTVIVSGSNYSVSTSISGSQAVITIKSNTSEFGHYVTPDLRSVTNPTLTYTVDKNGKYTFYMFDKNNVRIEVIVVEVTNIKPVDTTKPVASCTASVKNKVTTYKVTASDASGIAKYVHNGKTYTTSTFNVSTITETDTVRVYDNAGNYTDTLCVYSPISSGSKPVIASYNGSTLKYWIEKPGTYYTVTHIWVKDAYNQLNAEVNTNFGTLETTNTILNNVIRKYGYSNKAMIAINASGFLMEAGSNYENYVKDWRLSPTSPVIFIRGKLVRNFTGYTLPSTNPVYGLKKNGYLTYYSFGSGQGSISANKKVVEQMKSDGIRNTVSFNPVLVKNYSRVTSDTSNNIRQAICQIDRNNFIIITNTNSTNNRGVGFNFKDLADYMVSLNCRTGYNLDGGGSTNFYYKKNNSSIYSIVTTSRKVADILYFVEQ